MVTQSSPCRRAVLTLPDASGVWPVSGHKGTCQQRRDRLVEQEVVLQVEGTEQGRYRQMKKRREEKRERGTELKNYGRFRKGTLNNSYRGHDGIS